MHVRWGQYQHATNEAAVTIDRKPKINEGGQVYGYDERWNISGMLLAADAAALKTSINALLLAYAAQNRDIGLYFDDGSPTSHILRTATTMGGTRVTSGPSFPQGTGAEGGTFRTYAITVEGEVTDARIRWLAFHEELNFEGGGPMFGHLQPIEGYPQKQLFAQATPYRVTQTGQAIGLSDYPIIPGPIWPAALMRMPRVRRGSPKRSGPIGAPLWSEFPISWSYEFESIFPLVSNPNRWIN